MIRFGGALDLVKYMLLADQGGIGAISRGVCEADLNTAQIILLPVSFSYFQRV